MRLLCTALVLTYGLFVVSNPCSADPLVIRSVNLTGVDGAVQFDIVLDRAPDFLTVDQFGRNFDGFQLTLTHNMENPFLFRDVWIQGFDLANGFIPVYPMQPNGLFGPLSASVPYSVSLVATGHLLSFSVPFGALSSPDSVIPPDGQADAGSGAFFWFLAMFQYGGSPNQENHARGQYPINVPEPNALVHCVLGIAFALSVAPLRRRIRPRSTIDRLTR